jgi:TM2 domain-containing membrane protein YozV
MTSSDSSDKSRGVALALAVFLGYFGAHRFYAGKVKSGILMLCTVGGLGGGLTDSRPRGPVPRPDERLVRR